MGSDEILFYFLWQKLQLYAAQRRVPIATSTGYPGSGAKREKVMWKLFIDDERNPVTDDWVIARSSEEAIYLVEAEGMPNEIAFDHDLGFDDTSMKFLNWLTEQLIEGRLQIPTSFKYSIHSMNPVGARMIANRMNALLEHFGK